MAEQAGWEPRYTLTDAAAKFFPGGQITKRSLLTEIRKGRLRAECVAAKYLVTERAIKEMCEASALATSKYMTCHDRKNRLASTSGSPAPSTAQSGSSDPERQRLAREQAQRTLQRLKKP